MTGIDEKKITGIKCCPFFFSFKIWRASCGILVPQPGTEPEPLAVKASHNHWITGNLYLQLMNRQWINCVTSLCKPSLPRFGNCVMVSEQYLALFMCFEPLYSLKENLWTASQNFIFQMYSKYSLRFNNWWLSCSYCCGMLRELHSE